MMNGIIKIGDYECHFITEQHQINKLTEYFNSIDNGTNEEYFFKRRYAQNLKKREPKRMVKRRAFPFYHWICPFCDAKSRKPRAFCRAKANGKYHIKKYHNLNELPGIVKAILTEQECERKSRKVTK